MGLFASTILFRLLGTPRTGPPSQGTMAMTEMTRRQAVANVRVPGFSVLIPQTAFSLASKVCTHEPGPK